MPTSRRAASTANPPQLSTPLSELPPVTISEHDGVRYLHLGSIWIQGGMRMRKPDVVELDYVQRMLASLLWLPTDTLARRTVVLRRRFSSHRYSSTSSGSSTSSHSRVGQTKLMQPPS